MLMEIWFTFREYIDYFTSVISSPNHEVNMVHNSSRQDQRQHAGPTQLLIKCPSPGKYFCLEWSDQQLFMSASSPILVAAVSLLATICRLTTVLLAAIRRRGLAAVCSPAIPWLAASVDRRLTSHVLLLWDAAAWVAPTTSVPCVLQTPRVSMPRPRKLERRSHIHGALYLCRSPIGN